jgi:hypothetical protein
MNADKQDNARQLTVISKQKTNKVNSDRKRNLREIRNGEKSLAIS